MKKQTWIIAMLVGVGMMFLQSAHAQSSDALLDKLVEKGILTVKEANEMRAESDKGFATALSSKMGMPDWVQALKLNGDVRVRYEHFDSPNKAFIERDRFRYRLRFGATVQFLDDFEAGFRFTSSEQTGGSSGNAGASGGDPISGNTSFQDNGSKKFIYLDQVYGRWTPFKGPHLMGSFTAGKMENPFVFSDMVFDADYTPEGFAAQMSYVFNDRQAVRLNGGAFVLDEFSSDRSDPFLFGAQARWDATWTPKFQSSLGLAGLIIGDANSLTNSAVPNVNRGNTRDGNGALRYGYESLVADASVTYTLSSAPFYAGPFPIRLAADYIKNLAAPDGTANDGYSVSLALGKAGKRKTWEVVYTYKYLGADAWWEELVDSDFGGFYAGANTPPNSGMNIGYGSGTNVRGHIFRLAYSPSDCVTFSVKVFLTELDNTFPVTAPATSSKSDMTRIQVDALWKF